MSPGNDARDEDVQAVELSRWQRGGLAAAGVVLVGFVLLAIGRWRLDGAALTVLAVTGVIALAVALIGVLPSYLTHNGYTVRLTKRRKQELTATVDQFASILNTQQLEDVQSVLSIAGTADRSVYDLLRASRTQEHLDFEKRSMAALQAGFERLSNVRLEAKTALETRASDGGVTPSFLVNRHVEGDGDHSADRRFVVDIKLTLNAGGLSQLARFAVLFKSDVVVLVSEPAIDNRSGAHRMADMWNTLLEDLEPKVPRSYALWITTSAERVLEQVATGLDIPSRRDHAVHFDVDGIWRTA